MPCALGMTVPSTQSIVLIVIQLMADSRRHNYQHRYCTAFPPKNQDGIRCLWLFSATIFNIAKCLSPIFHGIIKAPQNHSHIHIRPALKSFGRVCFGFIFFPPMEYGLVIIFSSAVIVFTVNCHSLNKQCSQFFNDCFSIFDFLLIVFAITSHLLPPNQ